MSKSKRIFLISDSKDYTDKLLLTDIRKRAKGFIRLGHDVQVFSPNLAIRLLGGITHKLWVYKVYKPKMDELIVRQIRNYCPDIVYLSFAKYLDLETISRIREAASGAVLVGYDVDIFPEQHSGRVLAASGLDLLLTTYAGHALVPYENKGVRCIFLPNVCDPDIEYRYPVSAEWESGILFTGRIVHRNYPTDEMRCQLLSRLLADTRFVYYGPKGRRMIGGIDYYYAISGAKIGLSINADNNIPLYHSDRLTHYLACGTMVVAKKVPDSEKLFIDKRHLRYFDSVEEFFDLADWYLDHEQERLAIANEGMEYVHREFSCEKIAKYTLDAIEMGTYSAPWC
ncbi:MAG: glycosyltransferase [Smithella sp.]|jgi:glycosyltransferase involved in cell wall biosynthesis|nr:glycosyltransferase [Smithella sp.]